MNKFIEVTQEMVDKFIYLREVEGLGIREIGERVGCSGTFVSRVLNKPEEFLNRIPKKSFSMPKIADEKRSGKRCSLCGILYQRPHGYRVACETCIEHQRNGHKPCNYPPATIPVVGD